MPEPLDGVSCRIAPRVCVLLSPESVESVESERWYLRAAQRPYRLVEHARGRQTQSLGVYLLGLPVGWGQAGSRIQLRNNDPLDFRLSNLRFRAGTLDRLGREEQAYRVRVTYLGRHFCVGAPDEGWAEGLLARAEAAVLSAYRDAWPAERLMRALYREFKDERHRKWSGVE